MNEKKELIVEDMVNNETEAEFILNEAKKRISEKEMISNDLSLEDAIIYVGENSETFVKNFKALEKNQVTFSFLAAFLGPVYFLYRKMYLSAAIFILANTLVAGIPFLEIMMMLIMGICGYFLYWNKAKYEINLINKKYKNQTIRKELIRQRGGTNTLLPVIYLGLWAIGFVILFYMISTLVLI